MALTAPISSANSWAIFISALLARAALPPTLRCSATSCVCGCSPLAHEALGFDLRDQFLFASDLDAI